jgi:uncharacterized protein YodC (DUF2158 family)
MNIGDVVQVKSGGPYMTITSVGQDKVVCVWFVDNKPEHSAFPVEVLELVDEN